MLRFRIRFNSISYKSWAVISITKFYYCFFRKKNLLKKNPNMDQNYSDLQGRLDSTDENQYDHLGNVVYENSLN